MKVTDEIKELQENKKRIRENLIKLSNEVRAVLAEDLKDWPSNEVKKRFYSNPDFANTLDDSKVKQLKTELQRRAQVVSGQIVKEMEDQSLWLEVEEHEGPGKSFAENKKLWAKTLAIVKVVKDVMDEFGFPDSIDRPVEYKMPMRFISGKYLPGLAEKYWRWIQEMKEIDLRIKELEKNIVEKTLAKRWDDA